MLPEVRCRRREKADIAISSLAQRGAWHAHCTSVGRSFAFGDLVMRYRALAMDGDGTLTERGRMDDATAQALERVGRAGCKLLLVTGETLDELKQFPHVKLFDGVVAEDGGVLVWPS